MDLPLNIKAALLIASCVITVSLQVELFFIPPSVWIYPGWSWRGGGRVRVCGWEGDQQGDWGEQNRRWRQTCGREVDLNQVNQNFIKKWKFLSENFLLWSDGTRMAQEECIALVGHILFQMMIFLWIRSSGLFFCLNSSFWLNVGSLRINILSLKSYYLDLPI